MLTSGVKRNVANPDRIDTIRVYSFEDENLAGTFSNDLYGSDVVFESLMSLILLIEDCMNAVSFPRPMASLRKLDNVPEFSLKGSAYRDMADAAVLDVRKPSEWSGKPVAEFSLRIIFRTLSGWQGEVTNVGTDERVIFRSDLELIAFLVDETRKCSKWDDVEIMWSQSH